MFEREKQVSEIFVVCVCVLLSGFCWVNRGLVLAHMHYQIKQIFGEEKTSACATYFFRNEHNARY